MLLSIDKRSHMAQKKPGSLLLALGLNERGLQDIHFNTLDRLFPDFII